MISPEIAQTLMALMVFPADVSGRVRDLSDDALRFKPTAADFCFTEHACHLRDLEREGYAVRINRILGEDHPVLSDFDGTRVAAERDYQSQDFLTATLEFTKARLSNVEKLCSLAAEHFQRTGEFEGTGPITLEQLLGMMREHDETHRQEIAELRAACLARVEMEFTTERTETTAQP